LQEIHSIHSFNVEKIMEREEVVWSKEFLIVCE
jgi:hypothetical protein